jgi:hypothetical protein
MKKWGIFAAILLLLAGLAMAAEVRWSLPDKYVDNTAIAPADQAKITVEVFTGPSAQGPWGSAGIAAPGATSFLTAPDPARGTTLWYNAKATLNGKTSAYGVANSASLPFQETIPPGGIIVILPPASP